MIDGRKFFNQAINNYIITNNNMTYVTNAQGDGYKSGCLWDYLHSKITLS